MSNNKACLVINPRNGQNLTNLNGVLAVLRAAGWKPEVTIKEYGGHAIELAKDAVERGCAMVIAYGGDGTLSQVVNGVMAAKEHSVVGLIPGGTANVWANEIGIPTQPVKAALTLVGSETRSVDIGHVEVASLSVPEAGEAARRIPNGPPGEDEKRFFLLMAGLGIDARVMSHVSKPLKYRLGSIAVGLSAVKEVPVHQPFPVEVRARDEQGNEQELWKGEIRQVVIGNTRKYADVVEITPGAYIDDGILDICLISGVDPLNTMQLVFSLLLRRHPDRTAAEYLHSAHFSITVPASVYLQLDGSAVKTKDFLHKSAKKALKKEADPCKLMVTYKFDVLTRALPVAIPRTYDNALFEHTFEPPLAAQEQEESKEQAVGAKESAEAVSEQENDTTDNGRKVTLIGAVSLAREQDVIVLAGTVYKSRTGETKPVAVRIDDTAIIEDQNGGSIQPAVLLKLREGSTVLVEGKQNKHSVIRAKRIVL